MLSSKTILTGVYNLDETLSYSPATPPPPSARQNGQWCASSLPRQEFELARRYSSRRRPVRTVLRFSPDIKGCLIKTEGFGEGHVGSSWNHNNTLGDPGSPGQFVLQRQRFHGRWPGRTAAALPICLLRLASQTRPSWSRHSAARRWPVHDGAGFSAERLRFFQIPGTALIVKGGRGEQAGASGIYDAQPTELRDIVVSGAINGIVVNAGDSKLSHIYVFNVAKDGVPL